MVSFAAPLLEYFKIKSWPQEFEEFSFWNGKSKTCSNQRVSSRLIALECCRNTLLLSFDLSSWFHVNKEGKGRGVVEHKSWDKIKAWIGFLPKLDDMRKSDLGDVNAVVSGYMLVANPSCDGEAESLAAFNKLHLGKKCQNLCPFLISLYLPPLWSRCHARWYVSSSWRWGGRCCQPSWGPPLRNCAARLSHTRCSRGWWCRSPWGRGWGCWQNFFHK